MRQHVNPLSNNFDQIGDSSDCFFIEADEPEKAVNLINKLVSESIPRRFNFNPINDIQILSPMKKRLLRTNHLNQTLQELLNKSSDQIERFGRIFRLNDRVLQTENDYDKDVFNGDLGYINKIDKNHNCKVISNEYPLWISKISFNDINKRSKNLVLFKC